MHLTDLFVREQFAGNSPADLLVATVADYNATQGTTLILPGSSDPTTKRYKRVGSSGLTAGSRVLVAKISGTYLILGQIY